MLRPTSRRGLCEWARAVGSGLRGRRKEQRWMRRRARAAHCGAHRQGKFTLGGSVGRSIGRSVGSDRGIDLPSSCALSVWGRLRGLGLCVSVNHGGQDFGRVALVRVWRSVCGCIGKKKLPGAGCLCGGSIPPPGVMEPALLGVAGWCCRGIGGCLPLLSRASARAAAIRSALCVVFGG